MRSKLIALATLIMMMAVVISPLMVYSDASDTDDATDNNLDIKENLIEAGYTVIERDGIEYVCIDDKEYELSFFLGLAIGLIVGAAIVGAIVLLKSSPDTSGITQEDVNKAIREGEAGKVMAALDTAKNLISGVLPADATLWRFTTNYWQRAAEYYVAEFWELGGTIDIDQTMSSIGLYNNISNYLYDWSEAIDKAYNNYLSHPKTNWNKSGLENMEMRIEWDNGGISGGTPVTSSYDLWSDFTQFVYTSSGNNIAYIDTEPPKDHFGDTEWYDTLYYFGSGSTTITNTDNGIVYRLDSKVNDVNSIYCVTTSSTGKLPSGIYRFEDEKQVAGPIVPSGSNSAADVQGCMVFGNSTTTYYALSDKSDTSKVSIYNSSGNKVKDSTSLKYVVQYDGQSGVTSVESTIFGEDSGNPGVWYDLIGDYNELISSIEAVIYDVRESATATWAIFDIMEEADSAISPSAVRSMAEGIPMSAAEYVAMSIQMMIQIVDVYNRNSEDIENGSIIINPESLALYCFGNIYKNGILWAENVVFTPYINNTNQSLAVGSNVWAGTGYGMIWWQGENFASWTGSASLSQYTYVAFDKNTTLEIKQIVKDHKNVSSVLLTKSEIIKYNPGEDIPTPSPDIPQVDDNLIKTLVMIIIILLSILIFCGILLIDEDYTGIALLIAVVIGALLLLCSGVIVDMITGNFHIDWWPFW